MRELLNGPWEQLQADLFGLLLSKKYILVVQCLYSRFPAIETVTSASASGIILAMDKIMTNFDIPDKLGTDNGPPFSSQYIANFAKHMGFEHTRVTPYAPWANGTVKHFMRNLGKVPKTSHINDHNLKTALQRFLCYYRATPYYTTGYPPAQLLFNNRQYKTRLPSAKINADLFRQKEVQENDQCQKAEAKQKADNKAYVKTANLQTGDKVLRQQPRRTKLTSAFDP